MEGWHPRRSAPGTDACPHAHASAEHAGVRTPALPPDVPHEQPHHDDQDRQSEEELDHHPVVRPCTPVANDLDVSLAPRAAIVTAS